MTQVWQCIFCGSRVVCHERDPWSLEEAVAAHEMRCDKHPAERYVTAARQLVTAHEAAHEAEEREARKALRQALETDYLLTALDDRGRPMRGSVYHQGHRLEPGEAFLLVWGAVAEGATHEQIRAATGLTSEQIHSTITRHNRWCFVYDDDGAWRRDAVWRRHPKAKLEITRAAARDCLKSRDGRTTREIAQSLRAPKHAVEATLRAHPAMFRIGRTKRWTLV